MAVTNVARQVVAGKSLLGVNRTHNSKLKEYLDKVKQLRIKCQKQFSGEPTLAEIRLKRRQIGKIEREKKWTEFMERFKKEKTSLIRTIRDKGDRSEAQRRHAEHLKDRASLRERMVDAIKRDLEASPFITRDTLSAAIDEAIANPVNTDRSVSDLIQEHLHRQEAFRKLLVSSKDS